MQKFFSFLILIMNFLFFSCDNSDSSNESKKIVEVERLRESLEILTITPFSVSFDNDYSDCRNYYVSNNKETIEKIVSEIKRSKIKKIKRNSYLIDLNEYPDIFHLYSGHDSSSHEYKTIYGLDSNTTYYALVAEEYLELINISPIVEFKTENIDLYVKLSGSDVIWCGVNFIENRGEFTESQFIESQLFSKKTLPDPSEETIPGEWRYPTKSELEQLSKICKISLIDFDKMFMRLTDGQGNNLYLPFTNLYNDPKTWSLDGCAFPYSGGDGGLILDTGDCRTIEERLEWSPVFGSKLNNANQQPMSISSNFYEITVHYLTDNIIKVYKENRGVRFVMDK